MTSCISSWVREDVGEVGLGDERQLWPRCYTQKSIAHVPFGRIGWALKPRLPRYAQPEHREQSRKTANSTVSGKGFAVIPLAWQCEGDDGD